MISLRFRRTAVLSAAALTAAALALTGCSGPASTAPPSSAPSGSAAAGATPSGIPSSQTLQLAYLSFAVANSYDAPMLSAAQAVASSENAKLTVFDANNDPQTQFTQFQNAIASGKYQGIITQPILATGLTSLVQQAVAKGIKVVNIDQTMGPSFSTDAPQVAGLSANVTFVASQIGTQLGQQAIAACASKSFSPCNVGYLYDIKASTLDVAIRNSFNAAIAGSPVKVVIEGQDFFTPADGVTAVQNMLQAQPDLNLVVGSDQGLEGALQAFAAAKKTGKILLVGYGASAAGVAGVESGAVFSDVAQAPASEGQLGTQALIAALRTGKVSGAIDPVASMPNHGLVTKATAKEFTPEWPG